jgi:G:T-mismatch repair DNA endonuclease (very short patch repair protein)
MLMDSILHGDKRYAVYNGVAYAAQCHLVIDGNEFWHGYPEAWVKVPESIRRQWIKENKVKRSMFRRYRAEDDLENL